MTATPPSTQQPADRAPTSWDPAAIIRQLDAFYRAHGIHPEKFACAFRGDCSAGCSTFTEARASLVGWDYDGLVILSLDPGKGWPGVEDRTFEAVQDRERHADATKWRLHWRETHALVSALLGRPSRGAFAHVNAAKCTQNKRRNGQADSRLFENCRGYLKEELSILRPRVIVTQGAKAHAAFEPIADAKAIDANRSVTSDGAFWIRAYHPGARKPYWDQKRSEWGRWAEWVRGHMRPGSPKYGGDGLMGFRESPTTEGPSMKTYAELTKEISQFAADRAWDRFHSPKNLAMALAVEAAELLEHFQWTTEQESLELDEERLQAVAYEIADVQIYLMRLAERLGIDVLAATDAKLKINQSRYPVEKAHGSARKYTAYTEQEEEGSEDA